MEAIKQLYIPTYSSDEKDTALMSLLHASSLIKKQREAILERWEINQSKLNVLQILFQEFPGSLSQLQIKKSLIDKTIDLSRMIENMDRNCLITRRHNKTISEVMITRKGVEVLKEINGHRAEMTRATAFLSDEELQQLMVTMQKITTGLAQNPATHEVFLASQGSAEERMAIAFR